MNHDLPSGSRELCANFIFAVLFGSILLALLSLVNGGLPAMVLGGVTLTASVAALRGLIGTRPLQPEVIPLRSAGRIDAAWGWEDGLLADRTLQP